MEKTKGAILGFVFVLLGLLMVLHHLLVSGRFFDLGDMLHHEFFEAILFTAGIVLLITTRFNRK
jgi:formate-dependent nitrite reductase membrane component NrfD